MKQLAEQAYICMLDHAGDRYLEAVLIPRRSIWQYIVITVSVVLGVFIIIALLIVWQFPRLSKEFAAWQLNHLKSR